MTAQLLINAKHYPDEDTVIEIVLWQLLEPTPERPHGYKYRLHYGTLDGLCIVRYDNARGKGDHRHMRGKVEIYTFVSIPKLLFDFRTDVLAAKEQMR